MLIGYARIWRSGPDGQEEALRAAGCAIVLCDTPSRSGDMPARREAISMVRAGDSLVVVAPEVLGRSAHEILEALAELHELSPGKGQVIDLSTRQTLRYSPEAAAMAQFVARGADRLLRLRTTAGRKAATGRTGRKGKLLGPALEDAGRDWQDPELRGLSNAEIAERHGVTAMTMHRRFGPRSGGK